MARQELRTEFPCAGNLPAVGSIENLIEQASDIAIQVSQDGVVEGILVNPDTSSLGTLDHWVGKTFDSLLTIESREKYAERSAATFADPDLIPRALQLNHVDTSEWEFPIRYTLHRIAGETSLLLFGRDMQPIAEVQQRLVAEQIARDRDQQKIRSGESFYRVVLEASDTPLVIIEPETGHIRDLNGAAATLLGAQVDQLTGSQFAQALEGDRKNQVLNALRTAASAEDMKTVDVSARRTGRDLVVFAQYFRAAGDLYLLCRLSAAGSADTTHPEAALSLSALYTEASDAIVLTDEKGLIREANEAFLILTDSPQIRDIRNASLGEFLARGGVDLKLILETTIKKGRVRNYSTQLISSIGARTTVDVSSTRLRHRGDELGFGLIIREIAPRDVANPETGGSVMSEEAMQNVMDLVGTASLKTLVSATSDVIEKMCIETAIKLTSNNRAAAAEMLGLSRQSLYVKLRKHGLLRTDEAAE